MVREADFKDVPIMLELLKEAHDIGRYKEYEIDINVAKQILMGVLQRVNVRGEGGTCAFVYDDDGVQGLLLGVTERIYHIAKELRSTDIFFYIAKEYNDPLAFRMLLKSFEGWAWNNPKVKKIDLGITDIIGDPQRLAVIYKRFGYTESGIMVEKSRPEPF